MAKIAFTGTVTVPGARVIRRGRVTAIPVGEMPVDDDGSVLTATPEYYVVDANEIAGMITEGATYRINVDVRGFHVASFLATVPFGAGAITYAELYAARTETIPTDPLVARWGDNLSMFGSGSAEEGQVPAADGAGGVAWMDQTGAGGTGVTDHGDLTGLTDDDHPQYHTNARGDLRYSQLGHNHAGVYDPAGTASAAVAAHAGAADPHPGYLTPAEGNAAYAALGHNHAGVYDPAGTGAAQAAAAVTAHEAAADPHPGYLTPAEGNAAYSALGHNHAGVYSPVAHDHAGVYSPVGHGHTTGDVSGLDELIQDTIGSKLVEGTNITLTYDDVTGETTIDAAGGGGGSTVSRAIITEQNDGSVDAGTFTSGADRVRALNTEVSDPDNLVTLSSNQFTLVAGTYIIRWWAQAHRVGHHRSHIYDVTNSAAVGYSTMGTAPQLDGVLSSSIGAAIVTIATSTTFELRHISDASRSGDGFGQAWYNPSLFAVVSIEGVKA